MEIGVPIATAIDLKSQAHAMIDRMAPRQVSAVVTLLEAMLDPFAQALANAPAENELPDEDEVAAVGASRAWLQTHTALPNRDVLAEFGHTEEDFERMGQTPLCA